MIESCLHFCAESATSRVTSDKNGFFAKKASPHISVFLRARGRFWTNTVPTRRLSAVVSRSGTTNRLHHQRSVLVCPAEEKVLELRSSSIGFVALVICIATLRSPCPLSLPNSPDAKASSLMSSVFGNTSLCCMSTGALRRVTLNDLIETSDTKSSDLRSDDSAFVFLAETRTLPSPLRISDRKSSSRCGLAQFCNGYLSPWLKQTIHAAEFPRQVARILS